MTDGTDSVTGWSLSATMKRKFPARAICVFASLNRLRTRHPQTLLCEKKKIIETQFPGKLPIYGSRDTCKRECMCNLGRALLVMIII